MKILDLLSKISVLIILGLLVFNIGKLTSISEGISGFYEYRGSKINLQQVKKITPRVDYIITYKEDDYKDIFRKYSTSLNDKEIDNIEKFLKLASKSEYYNIEVIAYMMLDAQKVMLYHSEHFLKHPSKYIVNDSLLSELNSRGLDDFQYNNLEKIKDVAYNDASKFLDDVLSYAKLKDTKWVKNNIPKLGLGSKANRFMNSAGKNSEEKEISSQDIETLLKKLKSAHNIYLGIK